MGRSVRGRVASLLRGFLGLALLAGGLGTPTATQASDQRGDQVRQAVGVAPARDVYGGLPLSFEANLGQADAGVDFLARGAGYQLGLVGGDALLALRPSAAGPPATLRLRLVGANPAPALGQVELPGRVNYLVGGDPKGWHTGVPTYARVAYSGVYPGIDVVYYGNQGQLEHDFVVAPGVDPAAIQLAFEGADAVALDAEGDLLVSVGQGELRLRAPFLYQEIDGSRRVVGGGYALGPDRSIGFRVDAYDRSATLVIDPILVYSTYLGGGGSDLGYGIAVGSDGSAYVTGATGSTNLPAAGASPRPNAGGGDAFVAKINPAGSAFVYVTYLGSPGQDEGRAIAVDAAGSAYVAGSTAAAGFPTANAAKPTWQGSTDAFVAKLDPTGASLVYSTYLGGLYADWAYAIALDALGNAYVGGGTHSPGLATAGALQQNKLGSHDAFLTKLSASGALLYLTYLGGSAQDEVRGIAVGPDGQIHLAGWTKSANFPTVNAVQGALRTPCTYPCSDAFVARLNPAGSALVFSTYLGGSGGDEATGLAIDALGSIYLVGTTLSTDFPTANPLQAARGDVCLHRVSCGDAFVAKLNPAGSALVYATYLGGSSQDEGTGIAVGASGHAYVTGWTRSNDFPVPGPRRPDNGTMDGDSFVVTLAPSGATLASGAYVGGSGHDSGQAIALDGAGAAYVSGFTQAANFPTSGAPQPALGGLSDAFVAKLGPLNTAPVVDAGGPYVVPEGGFVVVEATGSDAEGQSIAYAWDLDGDGDEHFGTGGRKVQFSAVGLDGPSTRTIAVRATDSAGLSTVARATVTIENARPTATFAVSSAAVAEGDKLTLTFSGAWDPSDKDREAGFTYAVACGYGWSAPTPQPTHTCDAIQDQLKAVQGRVFDRDGAYTTYGLPVTVANLPPSVTVTSPAAGTVFPLGSIPNVSASFADPGVRDTHTCVVRWGDGRSQTGRITEYRGAGVCFGFRTIENTYTAPGDYTITVIVRDDAGAAASATVRITVSG